MVFVVCLIWSQHFFGNIKVSFMALYEPMLLLILIVSDIKFLLAEKKILVAFCVLPYLLETTSKKNPKPEAFLYQVKLIVLYFIALVLVGSNAIG